MTLHGPGSLVRARGREWVVLSGSDSETLRLRPVTGSEDDQTVIYLPLEPEPVTEATFPPPLAHQKASHEGALLLRDALLLSLRRGAGPFRSFGQIGLEPRAYQLVPLLMALKLDTVRLLIADDVGIGKTIEAALIARELLDRGELDRLAVLCPPHLVDQWLTELEIHFHIRAVAVTASGATRLERNLPPSESIFSAHPFTVVSLDYIKSDRRRSEFLRACPEFVIVDEAHTCAGIGPGRHQRYELLRGLSASPSRHLVLLTATPHSGDEPAFFRLLGLLHEEFEGLADAAPGERGPLRERLARHFVQRRRPDIAEWSEGGLFPRRETRELTYRLTGAWEQFFGAVLDYCAAVVDSAEGDERRQRLNFWGTLALMRCVASSPAAAVQALRSRAGLDDEVTEDELRERVLDGSADALPDDDVEPASSRDDPQLLELIRQANALAGAQGDPKLGLLTQHLRELIAEGFNPVVFCRFIATAHYLGKHLDSHLGGVTVGVVTGELGPDERKERVDRLGEAERRVLVATDCLSEGVNLQQHFDAVVHYDLSWNPTRHEQREGRVDRFGQTSAVVRATLLYGVNNPVDGAVLEVILRKAAKIRQELGVPVPVPDESQALTQVLLKAVLLKRRRGEPADNAKQLALFDQGWENAAERVRRNRTIFAQRRLKPDEVLPEWRRTLAAVGGREAVQRFVERAASRLGGGFESQRRGFRFALNGLPQDVSERLESAGLRDALRLDFSHPPAPGCRLVTRSHPLVAVLADSLLERTLGQDLEEADSDPAVLGRVGCWVSGGVTSRTVVALLRLRHQLVAQRGPRTQTLLVEEATALAWVGSSATLEGDEALGLLVPPPLADPPPHVRERAVGQALQHLGETVGAIDSFANHRAQALIADHRRVREASDARGSYSVKALQPVDVVGLFTLLPPVS